MPTPSRRSGEAVLLALLASSWAALAVAKFLDGGAGIRGPLFRSLFLSAGALEGLIALALIWPRTRRLALSASAAWAFVLVCVNLTPARWFGDLLEGCRCFGAMETSAAVRQLVASLLFAASAWNLLGRREVREESPHVG